MRNKRTAFILLLVSLCALLTGALAEATSTLKTYVPDTHTVVVRCGKNGAVRINGVRYTGTFHLDVARLSDLTITAEDNSNYGLDEITVIPEDGATVRGYTAKVNGIYEDKQIIITFRQRSPYRPTEKERLYDAVLGTGHGPAQLDIVYDETGEPRDYDLLPIEQSKELLIVVGDECTGIGFQRSLLLRVAQLNRLAKEEDLQILHFRNGVMNVSIETEEVTSGPIAWLVKQSYRRGLDKVKLEDIPEDTEALAKMQMFPEELAHTRLELRTVMADVEPDMWEVKAFLRSGNKELDVSPLLTTMRVSFIGPELEDIETAERLESGILYDIPVELEYDRCPRYEAVYNRNGELRVFYRETYALERYRMLVQDGVLYKDDLYYPNLR